MNKLKNYRRQIDEIDEKIIRLLALRMKISGHVGTYKKEKNIEVNQQGRWEEVLKSRRNIAKHRKVSKKLVTNIWNLIHEESKRLQEKK